MSSPNFPSEDHVLVGTSYSVWSFVIDSTTITYEASARFGTSLYGRPVVPEASTGRLRLCREDETSFGYLVRVSPDGWAECVARQPDRAGRPTA